MVLPPLSPASTYSIGTSMELESLLNKRKKTGKMVCFQFHNLTFYFLFSYVAIKKCFIISVMLPEDVETASKYNMLITVSQYPDAKRKLTYEGPVLSIEDLPNMKDKKANLKYWFVAYDALEPYFVEMIQGINTIPIKLEVLKI